MRNLRSTLQFDYGKHNILFAVINALLVILGLIFLLITIPSIISYCYYGVLAVFWGYGIRSFRKQTNTSFLKFTSLQLIICGLLGSATALLSNRFIPVPAVRSFISVIVLLVFMILISRRRCSSWTMTGFVSFLLFPVCLLADGFFLVTAFLSSFLLILSFFNGTLLFDQINLDDDEYFGNSSHR